MDTITSVKKKSSIGLFPQMWSSNNTQDGWIAQASSEFSSSFLAYNVTTPSGEWATNNSISNFWIQVNIPNYLPAIEPYGIAIRGRSNGEFPTAWELDVSNDPSFAIGTFTPILYSNTTIVINTSLNFYNFLQIFSSDFELILVESKTLVLC